MSLLDTLLAATYGYIGKVVPTLLSIASDGLLEQEEEHVDSSGGGSGSQIYDFIGHTYAQSQMNARSKTMDMAIWAVGSGCVC